MDEQGGAWRDSDLTSARCGLIAGDIVIADGRRSEGWTADQLRRRSEIGEWRAERSAQGSVVFNAPVALRAGTFQSPPYHNL